MALHRVTGNPSILLTGDHGTARHSQLPKLNVGTSTRLLAERRTTHPAASLVVVPVLVPVLPPNGAYSVTPHLVTRSA